MSVGRVWFEAALIPNEFHGTAPRIGRMLEDGLQFYGTDIWVVFVAEVPIDVDGRGCGGVDGIPDKVHRVRSHIAHLADANIAVHIPEEAVQAAGTTKVLRAVGMVR